MRLPFVRWAGCIALGLVPTLGFAADPKTDLVVAVNELARSLDPGAQTGNVDVRIYYSVFDNLIRRDFTHPAANGGAKLVPSLASSWRWADPTTLEVSLRQGVTCH